MVVVVEVLELEAEEMDVGDSRGFGVGPEVEEMNMADGGGSRTGRAGAGCWVLRRMRDRVCARIFRGVPCMCRCWFCGWCLVWCVLVSWSRLGHAGRLGIVIGHDVKIA